jgi:hypothetical protein
MNENLTALLNEFENPQKEEKSHTVVRLTTTMWHDNGGVYTKQTFRFLKRKCNGYNIIKEDCDMAGAKEVIPRIINLSECKDGLYEIVICNERGDWETPHILDDWDYKLIPFEERKTI